MKLIAAVLAILCASCVSDTDARAGIVDYIGQFVGVMSNISLYK